MLRMIQNSTPSGAKSYYSSADYYTEGQELIGLWQGKGAARLGLSGQVQREDWDALCDNRDPQTGATLTSRQKTNRRVGYDFNFHVPKSVSVAYGLTGDERILEAFRDAVRQTMADMEAEMQTRVRVEGKNEDRTTGNMVWGEFVHFTSRPVDGIPDPHLHAHCFVFNTTWDGEEERWKAGQFAGLKRDAPYFEAVFHSRLSKSLDALGFAVERTRKGWELAGVPKPAIREFSRRTALIEEEARERGITDPREKGELGAKTRGRKRKELTMDELREVWRSRLPKEDGEAIDRTLHGPPRPRALTGTTREAVELALSHCFERSAVMPERRVLTQALKNAYGEASPEMVQDELARTELLSGTRDGERLVTTREVLAEEQRMLAFARDGRGACRELAPGPHVFTREWLNSDQRKAIEHILGSRDRVILVRGGAGTGKTAMMQEAAGAIEAQGKRVLTLAPSAEASRGVLRSEGFKDADTVARLLLDEGLQRQARGQVIWIDEAGLLGSRTMAQLFNLAERLQARVVLSGDRRQHGSVERGAPLRLLEDEAGLVPAELREIQRQKGDYKHAVEQIARGRVSIGLAELDRMGWVKEVADDQRYELMAHDYVSAIGKGQSALVVSPTHREGDIITGAIRKELKRGGTLGPKDHGLPTLTNLNLTEAERRDPVNFQAGDVLVFHQNAKGHAKGTRLVVGRDPLPLDQAARFQVFRSDLKPIAAGETLRITRNGMTADGKHRLNNGQLVKVAGFDKRGNPVLDNGWKVAKDFGHLTYGYVVTSHASQGKTVDHVLIGEDSASGLAASREQFYVSVSRGRRQTTIYTDDRHALTEAVSRGESRLAATELVRQSQLTAERAQHERGGREVSRERVLG